MKTASCCAMVNAVIEALVNVMTRSVARAWTTSSRTSGPAGRRQAVGVDTPLRAMAQLNAFPPKTCKGTNGYLAAASAICRIQV
ncbi:MAG: hypothetical protein EPN74_11510 [Rhodanobacter sp.]|nr:MAG: hypothetical protein EPN74_11510 [Rhodanobacter sp.]